MGLLKHHDYVKILNYYDMPISAKDSSKSIKHKAEAILAEKLCKCIKKVKKNDRQDEDSDDGDHGNDDNKNTLSESESKAIAICSNSIFEKKGLERGLFDCKKKPRLINFQGNVSLDLILVQLKNKNALPLFLYFFYFLDILDHTL